MRVNRGFNTGNLSSTKLSSTSCFLDIAFDNMEDGLGDNSSRHFTNTNEAYSGILVKRVTELTWNGPPPEYTICEQGEQGNDKGHQKPS